MLRFTLDGLKYEYDLTGLVKSLETRTSLTVNSIERVLTYMAEVGKDSITAAELGSMLHLADLGDVSSAGAKDGSLIFYEKSSNCGEGCVGTGDKWKPWNALDEQVSSATYPMVFNSDGKPKVLERPQSPNKYYQLGWNAGNQLSYSTVPIVATAPVGSDGKRIALYLDPDTNRIVGVKE